MGSSFFEFNVIAVVVPVVIGIGFALMPLSEYKGTKFAFILSAGWFAGGILMLAKSTTWPLGYRAVFSILVFGLLGFALLETLRWVDQKRAQAQPIRNDKPLREKSPESPPTADQAKIPPATKEKTMKEKPPDNSPQISNSPNAVVSINQQGGITAGTVIINMPGIPPPKLELQSLVENQQEGELYRTDVLLNITTQVPIPNLYLQANAADMVRMDVSPMRAGGFLWGHSGTRDGFAFTNIQTAYGKYRIRVITKKPNALTIDLKADG